MYFTFVVYELMLDFVWFDMAASLPKEFDTPMFWSREDVEELRGTAVVGRYVSLFSLSPSIGV
jgi:hypothetical protein